MERDRRDPVALGQRQDIDQQSGQVRGATQDVAEQVGPAGDPLLGLQVEQQERRALDGDDAGY